jgi:hypothetical protein
MAREELLLAPESLEALIAGLADLGVVFGTQAAPALAQVRERLEAALAARKAGDVARAVEGITAAMRTLAELANALDPREAAMMRAIAAQFTGALQRGDAAHAAEQVDTMRKQSGAVKKRGDEFKL